MAPHSKKSSEYTTIVVGNWPTESSMDANQPAACNGNIPQ